MDPRDQALLQLLQALDAAGYAFVTPTPATHARVLRKRAGEPARDLRDVLGWSLPFAEADLDPAILGLLRAAGALTRRGARLKSRVRVSTIAGRLFLHSAYPTRARDAVFLGPDSYRFAALVARELAGAPPRPRILDVGTGAGVGALVAADACPDAAVTASDLNPEALRLARINFAHAGRTAAFALTSGLDGLDGPFDAVLANPPYMGRSTGRLYRDGGDMHGARLSLEWARAAIPRLAPGGRLILYTGAAVVAGGDALRAALANEAARAGFTLRYQELDPDVFGETVSEPGYEDVERIAAVAAVIARPG